MTFQGHPTTELKAALRRAFANGEPGGYIRMDGMSCRNEFLRTGWNYGVEMEWLRVVEVELEQETFLKGYLTEKGRVDLAV